LPLKQEGCLHQPTSSKCITCNVTTLLGDIADKRFRLLRHCLPFRGLFVSLTATFVHCAQTAEDIDMVLLFLLHTTTT